MNKNVQSEVKEIIVSTDENPLVLVRYRRDALIQMMKARGMGYVDVAKESKVPVHRVRRIFKGLVKGVGWEDIKAIGKSMGVEFY